MNQKLKQQFDLLESQRTELLNKITNMPLDKLNWHAPGSWSLNQVFAHLITSEQLSVRYLKKKIQGIESLPDTGLIALVKTWTLIVSQRLPLKFKAPKVVVEHTPVFTDAEQINSAWSNVRAELKALLAEFSDSHIHKQVYKHPIAGKLNIQQALRFLQEHIIHHQPQIKRLLKQN